MGNLHKEVPFDQYSRQYQVAAMVNELRAKNETFRILDVGGYKGRTADFFPSDEVIVLDVFDVSEPSYVKGDGLNLPFEDDSFDFVVNFDVLEHIPAAKRLRFVDECVRVAGRAAFFSAPHKTAANSKAEQALNALYKELHRRDHRWLKEHIEYELPNYEAIEAHLNKRHFYTCRFSSNDTLVWHLMQGVIFLNSKFPMAAHETTVINEYYNQHFSFDGGVDEDHTYRLILVASKTKQAKEKLNKQFAKKNQPLSLEQKIELSRRIHHYQALLLRKMSNEASNLRALYEHESKRASELHKNNEQLWNRIAELESALKKTGLLRVIGLTRRGTVRIKNRLQNFRHETNRGRND